MKKLLCALLLCASPAAAQNYNPGQLLATDCSGTALLANTATVVIPPNTAAHGWRLQNLDTTEGLWWTATGTVAAPAPPTIGANGSFVLAAGTATTFAGVGVAEPGYGFGTAGALTIRATTAAHKYACMYW